jgi:hypothetical protein
MRNYQIKQTKTKALTSYKYYVISGYKYTHKYSEDSFTPEYKQNWLVGTSAGRDLQEGHSNSNGNTSSNQGVDKVHYFIRHPFKILPPLQCSSYYTLNVGGDKSSKYGYWDCFCANEANGPPIE